MVDRVVPLALIAWHEAGHAVVAAACGFGATRCDILPGDGALGHFKHRDLTQEEEAALQSGEHELIGRLAAVSLAGAAGESLFYDRSGVAWEPRGWDRDLEQVQILADHVQLDARSFTVEHFKRAERFLSQQGRIEVLECLANELLERKELTAARLAEFETMVPPWDV